MAAPVSGNQPSRSASYSCISYSQKEKSNPGMTLSSKSASDIKSMLKSSSEPTLSLVNKSYKLATEPYRTVKQPKSQKQAESQQPLTDSDMLKGVIAFIIIAVSCCTLPVALSLIALETEAPALTGNIMAVSALAIGGIGAIAINKSRKKQEKEKFEAKHNQLVNNWIRDNPNLTTAKFTEQASYSPDLPEGRRQMLAERPFITGTAMRAPKNNIRDNPRLTTAESTAKLLNNPPHTSN